jgi:uncharacterized paraquat-inducible protein A
MIKLDISTAIFIYLMLTTVSLLLVWSFLKFGTKLKTFSSEEKYVWHCPICAFTYIDSKHDDISKCPRCGSYNQRVRDSLMEEGGMEQEQ